MSSHVQVPWSPPHHPPCERPLLEGVDIASPLLTGYMYKEAHTHVVFHKRFFVLFPGVLVYYEKETDYRKDVAKGSLEHQHKAIALGGLYLSKPEKKAKGAKFCFILHAPDKSNPRHDFLLVTETKESRKKWIDALQDQNPELLVSEHQSLRIHPDTPQLTHRAHSSNGHNSEGHTMTVQCPPTVQVEYPVRPGSPRHDIHRTSSEESSTVDHLDIQHLCIREGPSDTEDNI